MKVWISREPGEEWDVTNDHNEALLWGCEVQVEMDEKDFEGFQKAKQEYFMYVYAIQTAFLRQLQKTPRKEVDN